MRRLRLLWHGIADAFYGIDRRHELAGCRLTLADMVGRVGELGCLLEKAESEAERLQRIVCNDGAAAQLGAIARLPALEIWLPTGDGSIHNAVRCALQHRPVIEGVER